MMVIVMFITNIATSDAQYNHDYFIWMGRRQMVDGRYREAVSILNSLLHVDEKAYEGYFLRGVAKYNLGDLIGAEADLTAAIKYNPVYTIAYNYRAITRSRLGRYDEALRDFAEAIELRPDIPDPYYSRGVTRLLNHQFEEAIADFNHFISQDQKYSDAYINRGICHLQLKDTLAAYRDFTKAIETNRYNPDAYNRRGSLYMEQDKFDKAKEDFDIALERDSSHLHTLFNRALLLNEQHKPIDALSDLDRLLTVDSLNSLSYFNRAIILSQIGDYNTALKDFDQVAALSPDNVLIYFYRANLLSRLGEIELAEKDYTRAIELYPDFANAYLGRSHIRFLLKDSHGGKRDKEIAEKKIAEHKSKLKDSTYSIYADTTYSFDKLLSFDTKLAGSSFTSNAENQFGRRKESDLLAQFRFTLIKHSTKSFHHREYYDPQMEHFIASMDDDCFTISNRASNLSKDTLEQIITSQSIKSSSNGWKSELTRGIAQNIIKQYTSAIESTSNAILIEPNNPFLYLNRAVTRAEMIEFINSIESSFSRISINSDPANALTSANQQQITYDYAEAIADLHKSIALHPELAYSHYNLAGLLALSGELPQAYDAYSKAIKLYPSFAEAYYNRGVIQIMMKDNNKGVLDLSKAGELGIESAYDLLKRYSQGKF